MIVRENLNFEREKDPKRVMSIGRIAQIRKWFDSLGIDERKYTIYDDFNVSVEGSLGLSNTLITSLPERLNVGGSLYLSNTPITSLPKGLSVGGSLDLRNTKITSLPDGLSVGGDLYLKNTSITSLPEDLVVKGKIYNYDSKRVYKL